MNTSEGIKEKTIKFLMDMVAIPSTRGNEGPAARYAHDRFK